MNELRAGVPYQFDSITIIPIERVRFFKENKRASCWTYGSKEPVAVIVCDTQGVRALDLNSIEISMDSLQLEVPELTSILADIKG